MKAQEFDKIFDEGQENILDHVDLESATRPNQKQKRVNVDFPIWMIEALDKEAKKIGVTRQSVIKMWLAQDLERRQYPRK